MQSLGRIPLRRDPAPSRWAYRMQRLWLTPMFRVLCRVGLPGVVLASVTGFPSIAIPAGFSTPTTTAPLGVPIGIEFIGRPWSERRLLEIAAALEQARPVRLPPQL